MTNEEKILILLEQLQEGQKRTEERLDNFDDRFDKFDDRLGRLEADMKIVKKDTKEIKHNLDFVWEDIKRINNRLQSQEEKPEMRVK